MRYFLLTKGQNKQKMFFSHTAGRKWDEMHGGVIMSHDLLESNLFIAIYLACPAPRTYPSHVSLQGKGAVII